MKNSYLVIGSGRVGKSIALTIKKKKKEVLIWNRTKEKANYFCLKNKIKQIEKLEDFSGNFLIFCVKDSSLKEVIKDASKKIKGKGMAIHTSGIFNEEILLPLKENGWGIAKCHPIYSFPLKEKIIPEGIGFGVQCEKKDLKKVIDFLKIFKGKFILIPKGKEIIYHLALVFASNFPALFFFLSKEIFLKNFKRKRILMNLYKSTFENVMQFGKEGITGPGIRKDLKTIKMHKEYLKKNYPELFKIYNVLTNFLLKI